MLQKVKISRRISAHLEGWYSVLVTNQYGCEGTDSTYLTVHKLPQLHVDNYFVEETDTIVVNPGSFHSYLWSDGSPDSTLKIIVDDLPLGDNNFWVEVQNIHGCFSEEEFIVHVVPAERPVNEELILKVGLNKLSVTNKSAEYKKHEIIIYSLNGIVLYKEKIPVDSVIEFPIIKNEYMIIILKNSNDTFVKKLIVN